VDELDRARYISLTTFKRDGSPVSGPVWITGDWRHLPLHHRRKGVEDATTAAQPLRRGTGLRYAGSDQAGGNSLPWHG
jgi:hypothetical protein